MTEGSFVGLGLSIFGFTLASLMFWKEVAPQQYEKVKASIKESGKTIVEKIKLAGRRLRLSSVNEDGNIVESEIPPESIESRRFTPEAENPSNKSRWSKGTVAMTFIRVGFLCFMIYSFIQGRKHIAELKSQLQKDKEYFAEKGKF